MLLVYTALNTVQISDNRLLNCKLTNRSTGTDEEQLQSPICISLIFGGTCGANSSIRFHFIWHLQTQTKKSSSFKYASIHSLEVPVRPIHPWSLLLLAFLLTPSFQLSRFTPTNLSNTFLNACAIQLKKINETKWINSTGFKIMHIFPWVVHHLIKFVLISLIKWLCICLSSKNLLTQLCIFYHIWKWN